MTRQKRAKYILIAQYEQYTVAGARYVTVADENNNFVYM